jgi:hypothetical protein
VGHHEQTDVVSPCECLPESLHLRLVSHKEVSANMTHAHASHASHHHAHEAWSVSASAACGA